MATKKILEKMKQDENLRSFEGSSGPLSDDLEDSEDDDEGLSQVLMTNKKKTITIIATFILLILIGMMNIWRMGRVFFTLMITIIIMMMF